MAPIDTAIGFIAGEGSFCITKQRGSNQPYVGFRFDLSVDEKDEGTVIELRETFGGVGEINKRERDDGRVHVAWTVVGKEDLERLRDEIEKWGDGFWKSTEKYRNFKVWSDALDIWIDGKATGEKQVKIANMAKDLNSTFGTGWDEFIERRNEA